VWNSGFLFRIARSEFPFHGNFFLTGEVSFCIIANAAAKSEDNEHEGGKIVETKN